jgi:glycolate oxidase FAD binding subunit
MTTTADLATRLESVVEATRVSAGEAELREYAVDEVLPAAIVKAESAEEVAEVVRFATKQKLALIPCGARSKLGIGMPPARYDIALDMSGLRQIAHYDAGDLTLSVDAGMPVRELQRALAAKKQFLPLGVPCWATSTVGGAVASGIDSVLRQQYGTVRDFLIGAEFVDGRGGPCRSGGRVVKNVTGYDLHKLLIGSVGTLAAITRLNFRTYPLPEAAGGWLTSFEGVDAALRYYTAVRESGWPIANVELLGPQFCSLASGVLRKTGREVPPCLGQNAWCVYVSYEGNQAVVKRIGRELEKKNTDARPVKSEALDTSANVQLNEVLREAFDWLRKSVRNGALLRIVLPQVDASDVKDIGRLAQGAPGPAAFALRACGVAYLAVQAEFEDGAPGDALHKTVAAIFTSMEARHVQVTLLHAGRELKMRMNACGQKRRDWHLMQRVKIAFDPQNIFAPGRFVGGI